MAISTESALPRRAAKPGLQPVTAEDLAARQSSLGAVGLRQSRMGMNRPLEGNVFAEDFLRGMITELCDWRDSADEGLSDPASPRSSRPTKAIPDRRGAGSCSVSRRPSRSVVPKPAKPRQQPPKPGSDHPWRQHSAPASARPGLAGNDAIDESGPVNRARRRTTASAAVPPSNPDGRRAKTTPGGDTSTPLQPRTSLLWLDTAPGLFP